MVESGPFDASSAEQEILRLDRPAQNMIWQAPKGESFHLTIPPTVYPPREDTDLLAQALVRIGAGRGRKLLEIGCGSGALSILAARQGWRVSACDINPFAVLATREAAKAANASVIVNEGGPGPQNDIPSTQWSGEELHDVVLWNLPYLELPEGSDVLGPMEEAALLDTDQVGLAKRLIGQISKGELLSKHGLALILATNDQRGEKIPAHCIAAGLACRKFSTHEFDDGEMLTVYAIWHPFSEAKSEHREEVGSTNQILLETPGKVGDHLRADVQTAGRGRRGRAWSSERVAFAGSWRVHEGNTLPDFIDLQLIGGIAVQDTINALDQEVGKNLLKWPNDIMAQSGDTYAKLCGVLLEGRTMAKAMTMVLGIGVNFSSDEKEKDEFRISTIEDISDKITLDGFSKTLHAALASYVEARQEIPNAQSAMIYQRISQEIETTISELGMPLYRNQMCESVQLQNNGNLLVKTSEGEFSIDDGEDLIWNIQ